MIERLVELIKEYQARVQEAVLLFEKYKGVDIKSRGFDLPQSGFLDQDRQYSYFFHGAGCSVTFPDGKVID